MAGEAEDEDEAAAAAPTAAVMASDFLLPLAPLDARAEAAVAAGASEPSSAAASLSKAAVGAGAIWTGLTLLCVSRVMSVAWSPEVPHSTK